MLYILLGGDTLSDVFLLFAYIYSQSIDDDTHGYDMDGYRVVQILHHMRAGALSFQKLIISLTSVILLLSPVTLLSIQ